MKRGTHWLGWLLGTYVALLLGASHFTHGQDLGKLLERAAKDKLREVLGPSRTPSANPPANRSPEPAPSAGVAPSTNATATSSARHGTVVAIRTNDGWNLVAHHYRPTGKPIPGALPVILCHGLTYNATFWDLDPSCSFAEYLAAAGFDVWAVSLRGCGMSQKWVWSVEEAPEALFGQLLRRATRGKFGNPGYVSVDPKYANWTMDDHIAHDVPAFVYLVKKQTGASQVAWVGHSMGGIVALAHLARYPNPGIGRLVAIGSQLTMSEGQIPSRLARELLQTRELQLTGELRGAELVSQSKTTVQHLFFNTQNVAPGVYEALTTWATDIPAVGLMKQYLVLSQRGVLLDASGRFNYAQAVGNVKVPILLGCGATDQFAPPKVQKYLYDHVGSTDKTLVVFGRGGGYSADAGHDDALVGLNSRGEVFPVITRWLAAPH